MDVTIGIWIISGMDVITTIWVIGGMGVSTDIWNISGTDVMTVSGPPEAWTSWDDLGPSPHGRPHRHLDHLRHGRPDLIWITSGTDVTTIIWIISGTDVMA